MKAWIEVTAAGRATNRFSLDRPLVLGSADGANVKLSGIAGLESEHMRFTRRAEGCWVELTEEAADPFSYEGKSLRQGLVPWNCEIFVGPVRVAIVAEAVEAHQRVSPVLAVGVVFAGLLLIASFRVGAKHHDAVIRPGDNAPGLFAAAPPCSYNGDSARHRAALAEASGRAKHERGAFEPRDAVEAVVLMREAEQCYLNASREGDATRVRNETSRWIHQLESEYQSLQLRLHLALREQNDRQVELHSKALTNMLTFAGPEAQEYLNWLEVTRRKHHDNLLRESAQKRPDKGT